MVAIQQLLTFCAVKKALLSYALKQMNALEKFSFGEVTST